MQCSVCGESSKIAFAGKILKTYQVNYYRCENCDFLQTEKPYWLEEAYASAISDLDLGPVNRAVRGARVVEGLIVSSLDPNASFIDWGGGYGVFTRLMRDLGYDFYWRDPFCQNLFAKHFVASLDRQYEALTCFEVFEHLDMPMGEIAKMAALTRNIIFTTLIPPLDIKQQEDWWYFAPEHGQHIAFYSLKALNWIANEIGLILSTDGSGLHMFSESPISPTLFKIIARNRRTAGMLRRLGRRKLQKGSLLMDDFRSVTGWDV